MQEVLRTALLFCLVFIAIPVAAYTAIIIADYRKEVKSLDMGRTSRTPEKR